MVPLRVKSSHDIFIETRKKNMYARIQKVWINAKMVGEIQFADLSLISQCSKLIKLMEAKGQFCFKIAAVQLVNKTQRPVFDIVCYICN